MQKGITRSGMSHQAGSLCLYVVVAALAALFTMATALSVTDFLQLIFPSGEQGLSFSTGSVNPIERLLSKVYLLLVAEGPQRALILYAVLLFVLYGMKNVCSYVAAVSYAKVKTGVLREVRDGLHKGALRQNFAHWGSQQQGQWLSRMSNDVAEYEANVLDSIQMLVQSSITMLIYVVMLLYLDWRLTLLVVVVMAVGTLLLSASRRLKRQSRDLQDLNGKMMTTTQETIDSLKEIKAATAIDYVNRCQQAQNALFTRRRIGIYRRIYAASPLSDFVGNTIVVAILILGAYRVLGDSATLSASLFVSYVMIYVLLLTPIKDFSNAIAQLKKGRGVEERLAMETDNIPPATEQAGGRVERISLQGVSFAYGNHPVLSDVNWDIAMHSHTAVVGESGAGKTTLARLLVGLLQPQRGEILINGTPATQRERIGRLAYIPQEPMLFNASIEDNIRFGRPWVTSQQVEAAAEIAQVSSFLKNMPEGMNTVIGDGGSRLSGGERQRVNIARALVGNPDVVVMDEATAALDAATEQQFNQALRAAMHDRTMVVIAHRASTIAACNTIFNVERV